MDCVLWQHSNVGEENMSKNKTAEEPSKILLERE